MGASQQMLSAYTTPAAGVTYATWDPSNKCTDFTLSNGNLTVVSGTTTAGMVRSTISKTSGKWYWEETITSVVGGEHTVGISGSGDNLNTAMGTGTTARGYYGSPPGYKYGPSGALVAYGASYTNGDIIGIALDMTAGTLIFYKNNVNQGTAFTGISGTFFAATGNTGAQAFTTTVNFGATALTYSPPSGYNAGLYV